MFQAKCASISESACPFFAADEDRTKVLEELKKHVEEEHGMTPDEEELNSKIEEN